MSSESGSDGYVHDPSTADGERANPEGGEEEDPHSGDGEFGLRGWVLVAVALWSFFVVPAVVIYRPLAIPFEVAYFVLPLLPAFVLGAAAVWALAGRR